MRLLFLTVVFAFLMTSCREQVTFREYKKMDNVSWNRFDILNFEVPVKNGDKLDFELAVRHHTDLPFEVLWVNITFYSPDGTTRSRDYELALTDELGNWKADGLGDLWDIEFPIIQGMSFYDDGICKVRVENKMTKFETPGIIEVGLIVSESEEEVY